LVAERGKMNLQELETYVLSFPNTRIDFPFGEEVAVYKARVGEEEKMYALIPTNKAPLQISLKCDPTLAMLLREQYESVMEGYHLNKKHWNTILLSGQLSDEEVRDLIAHSYYLVIGQEGHVPDYSNPKSK
jgi:predicted DNA-binding protein (MmcQ/YjbR family)